MQDALPRKGHRGKRRRAPRPRIRHGKMALVCLALACGACSSSIKTPLPDVTPTVTSSISQPDRQKAMKELNQKGATHEQDAERQIEEAR